MAKISTGPIVAEARGKAGDVVFNRNRGGNYARALSLTATGAGAGDGAALSAAADYTLIPDTPNPATFDTILYDHGGLVDLIADPTTITIKKAGRYLITANAQVHLAAPGTVTLVIVDQLEQILAMQATNADGYLETPNSVACIYDSPADMAIYLYLVLDSAANATVRGNAFNTPNLAVQQLTGP